MTLLIIAALLYAVIGFPASVKVAKESHRVLGTGYSLVLLVLMAFFVTVALIFMSSIGHLAAGVWFFAPSILALVIGLVVGVAEEL
jgi:hypothetical protein